VSTLNLKLPIRKGNFALNVDLSIPLQGVTAVFGASGTGKTSLLRAIAGLDRHVGGLVNFADQMWQDHHNFTAVHKRGVGYVFQEDNLFTHLSVEENMQYGTSRASNTKAAVDHIITLLQLQNLLTRRPSQLSGGERQKVAIARALAILPKLLLMDEPLAALDQTFKQDFLPQLKALISELGIPLLYVSHAADEVAQLADNLVLLDKSGAAKCGNIIEMLTNPELTLAHRQEAESLLTATVNSYDAHYHLLSLHLCGQTISVSGKPLAPGTSVRVRILAQDVSITLAAQHDTSILNIFPVTIEQIFPYSAAQDTILLNLAGSHLLARITRKSKDLLGLKTDQKVFAQIKSVALSQ
jgi:molybdate transport system ATP-binding protein